MRQCTCKKCGCKFYENDSNPNIHYSNPSEVCMTCDVREKTPLGGYFQLPNGEYIKKI